MAYADVYSYQSIKKIFNATRHQRHIEAVPCITKTCLFKYTENFTTKNENFQIKNSDNFHISAQNIDYGY